MSRRLFIKRSGGATLAAAAAWNLSRDLAKGDEESPSDSVSNLQLYRMRLASTKPAQGWTALQDDTATTIDGNVEQIAIAIEILSSGNFQPSMISCDVAYSVIAYASIERNATMTVVATHTLELTGNCHLPSVWSPILESDVFPDQETYAGMVLPPNLEIDFTFNNGGDIFKLEITDLVMNGVGASGNETYVSASAKITGSGVSINCGPADVTHVFESFPLI